MNLAELKRVLGELADLRERVAALHLRVNELEARAAVQLEGKKRP